MEAIQSKRRTTAPMLPLAAGHASNGFRTLAHESDFPTVVLKRLDAGELEAYEWLAEHATDPIHGSVPNFCGVIEGDDEDEGAVPQWSSEASLSAAAANTFLVLSNVLQGFSEPCLLDVKLGVRSFLQSEQLSTKPRPDLFHRMEQQFPQALTDEEIETKSITKFRWMRQWDVTSTTAELGYRIEGGSGQLAREHLHIEALHTREDVHGVFRRFVESARGNCEKHAEGGCVSSADIASGLRNQLLQLRTAFESSEFVARHELIGTSVLLVVDSTGRCGVFWIDFAKVALLPEGVEPGHRSPWAGDNHADGVLIGLDNLIRDWADIAEVADGQS